MTNEVYKRNDIGNLSHLLDEYKYRHDLVWRLVFRLTLVVATLSVIPYLPRLQNNEVDHSILLIPPLLAVLVAGFGFPVMRNELKLFHKSVKSYHYVQDKFIEDVIDDEVIKEEVKHPQERHRRIEEIFFSRFDNFVWFYLFLLFILSAGNYFYLLLDLVPQFPHSIGGKMGELIGLAAVVLIFSVPFALMFTIYRLRKLKTEERLAAIAKGVPVSLEPEVPKPARLRGLGILLVASGVGFSLACWLMSLVERDVVVAAPLGVIPFAIGIGYFINASLIRRELSSGTKG